MYVYVCMCIYIYREREREILCCCPREAAETLLVRAPAGTEPNGRRKILLLITTTTTTTTTTNHIYDNKGQMGSALMGSLQLFMFVLTEGLLGYPRLHTFIFPKSAKAYLFP